MTELMWMISGAFALPIIGWVVGSLIYEGIQE